MLFITVNDVGFVVIVDCSGLVFVARFVCCFVILGFVGVLMVALYANVLLLFGLLCVIGECRLCLLCWYLGCWFAV